MKRKTYCVVIGCLVLGGFAITALAQSPATQPGRLPPGAGWPFPPAVGPAVPTNNQDLELHRNQELIAVTGYICANAIINHDVHLLKNLIWSDNDPDGKLAAAEAKELIAMAELTRALGDRFGGHASAKVLSECGIQPFDAFAIITAEWNVDGDKATAARPDGLNISFRKIKGNWKIDLTPPQGQGDTAKLAAMVDKDADAITKVTTEIANSSDVHDPSEATKQIKNARAGVRP